MRHLWLTLVFGSALVVKAIVPVAAQSLSDPTVVPGYYGLPKQAYDPGRGYVHPHAEPVYRSVVPMQAVQAYAPRPQPRFGGGLLDAVMGDHASEPAAAQAVAYAPRAAVAYNSEPDAYAAQAYAPGYAVQPAKAIDPRFQRQEVDFPGQEAVGTVVIDTTNKFLYLVQGAGRAMRYGIGVGRPGFLWHGEKTVTRKAEWPDWTPPSEMLLRRPDLPRHMEGGIANPLGARAMYLGSSLYRIHGTNEPETIGTNVSSGCIRLTNDDVSDLYTHVRVGTRVVVM